MHVRPEGVWPNVQRLPARTSIEFVVGHDATIKLKTDEKLVESVKKSIFLFWIAFASGTFSNVNMSSGITVW